MKIQKKNLRGWGGGGRGRGGVRSGGGGGGGGGRRVGGVRVDVNGEEKCL